MSYRTTAALDYQIEGYDEGETVTLTTNPGASATTSITYATPSDLSDDDMIAAGIVEIGVATQRWQLGADQISAANIPKHGDMITDASSVVWLVKAVKRDSLRTAWLCDCVRGRS